MMSKTHVVTGIAASLLLLHPESRASYMAVVAGGALGGVMADMDMKLDGKSSSGPGFLETSYGEIGAKALFAWLLVMDALSGGGICLNILDHGFQSMVGIIIFIALFCLGIIARHRDRTHSILAMVVFSVAVWLVHREIGRAFAVGYASHLLLDLLNKRPIRLFYPFRKTVCLRLFYADRLANEVFFALGICAIATALLRNV